MTAIRKAFRDPRARIERLLIKYDAHVRRAFRRYLREAADSVQLGQLATMLEAGRLDEALQLLSRAVRTLASGVTGVYAGSADATARFLREHGLTVDYDPSQPPATAWVRNERVRIIANLSQDQRTAVQRVVSDGIARGINPRAMAREIKQHIGLTPLQTSHVLSYRRLLQNGSIDALDRELRSRTFDRTVASMFNRGGALTGEQIERMVAAYANNYLTYRAEVIARTESLRAVHAGIAEMYRQSVVSGDLEPEQIVRVWNAASDSRVRSSHREMDGQERGFEEPFLSGDGNPLMYPGDVDAPIEDTVQCRCVVSTVIA